MIFSIFNNFITFKADVDNNAQSFTTRSWNLLEEWTFKKFPTNQKSKPEEPAAGENFYSLTSRATYFLNEFSNLMILEELTVWGFTVTLSIIWLQKPNSCGNIIKELSSAALSWVLHQPTKGKILMVVYLRTQKKSLDNKITVDRASLVRIRIMTKESSI